MRVVRCLRNHGRKIPVETPITTTKKSSAMIIARMLKIVATLFGILFLVVLLKSSVSTAITSRMIIIVCKFINLVKI